MELVSLVQTLGVVHATSSSEGPGCSGNVVHSSNGSKGTGGHKENVCQEVHHQEKQHSVEGAAPPAAPAEPVPVKSAVPVKHVPSFAESADPGELAEPLAPMNHLGLPASWTASWTASWRTGESCETVDAAATKVGGAAVPIKMWNDMLLEDLERETKFSQTGVRSPGKDGVMPMEVLGDTMLLLLAQML